METIEELAKEYANRHLDVSEELGCYLVKSVFLDGAEYQREKQDEFVIGFAEWLVVRYNEDIIFDEYTTKELLEIYKKEKDGN
jgi:hypothetical protein